MHRTLASLLSLGLLAVACGSTPAPTPTVTPTPAASPGATATAPASVLGVHEISGADFRNHGGCGDAYLWATTADGSMAITMHWEGAASSAWGAGGFHQLTQLADPALVVQFAVGRRMGEFFCNDVLMPGVGQDSSIDAVSGDAEIFVRPDQNGFQPAGHADAALQDVRFRIIDGEAEEFWHLDELVWENISVGWFAG
jgi:hypothetical protein